ncbi:hypothetical protein ACFRQM_52410 [Streptomyces sp. NPDC056831]|uniref:hypothetical protein n=1 Tax=Streptomyces sp. NPDC056831 TaxID=3345954 RepID=UPI0036C0FBD7
MREVRDQAARAVGLTSELHLGADGRCRPLSLVVTRGQRADCARFQTLPGKIRIPRLGPGRPRKKPGSLAVGEAYSNTAAAVVIRLRTAADISCKATFAGPKLRQ